MLSLWDSLQSSTHKGNSTRATHASRRNSASVEIQGQEVLSLQDTLRCSTHLSIRWRHCKILRPTRDFLQMHLQEPECFLVHKWCFSEDTHLVISRLLRDISTRRFTSKSSTGKDYLLRYLRSPAKSTFKRLCKQTPLWLIIMKKEPQEPQRIRRPQERDVEQSALTHACHTHCASRQSGTTADRRYDIPRDWLWDACQMARVHWGTRCKGFCSKEGPHYQMEQSARNQLERNQVQRAPEKSSRSCRQTSNNQPLFMSLEILGFLSRAVLRWLSGGLCHTRKCHFKNILWEEKVWFAIAQPTFAWETFGERRNGERMPVLIHVPGSHECLASRKRVMCASNMGADVQHGTWRTKGMRKRDETLDSRAAKKGTKNK